jgi:hypothetical protein
MMEVELFGYVIQHILESEFSTPFGIKHIVGMESETNNVGVIVDPSSQMISLRRYNGNTDFPISEEMLRFMRQVPGDTYKFQRR